MFDDRDAGDDHLARQLAALGLNLAKPQPVEHLFYFPKPDRAEMAAITLRAEGFIAAASGEPRHGLWSVIARGRMMLSVEGMSKSRIRMERLADQYGGGYDGWGIPLART